MSESIILIGGSGHARVIMDAITASGGTVAGILDDAIAPGTLVHGIPVLGKTEDRFDFAEHPFVIAIGNNAVRQRMAEAGKLTWATVIHPAAVVSPSARIGAGTVVMAGAVINADARVGDHCIVNTGAVVEHDNALEDYVHISPNAALGGTVHIGELTHVGIGACVRNNVNICGGCTVGAGAAVVKDIAEPGVYAGVPARRIR
jgi:sugar O-acyltransferase (sialic acid O-acetyltransferase NeuD family)